MPVVGIPYAPMPAVQSPNIRANARADDVYMKSSFVALASFARWNPGWRRVLFTTERPSSHWVDKFASIEAELVVSPFEHQPPAGFAPTFAGALYLLDAVETLTRDDYLLIIDPDVIAVGNVDVLLSHDGEIAALALDHGSEDDINRITLAGATRIHALLGEPRDIVTHYGGEFYGIPAALRQDLSARMNRAWSEALRAFGEGREFFTTEEHVMSFAIAGLPVRESSDLIRRIWTSHSYRTVTGDESDLALWHLPAEKQRSIAVAYEAAVDRDSWFWSSSRDDFVDRFGRLSGMHHRGPRRLAEDSLGRVKRGLQNIGGRR